MNTITIPGSRPAPVPFETRWLVKFEIARGARLGETVRDTMRWGVTPTKGRDRDNHPIRIGRPTYFATLTAAIAYARGEMRRTYGRHGNGAP